MTATAETDLAFAGAAAQAARVRDREVHPRELVELYLRRIERLDGPLNSFRVARAERALAEAEAWEGGDGPLAGVPIAVKDNMPLAGEAATRGARVHGPPATADAEPLRRLRAAGAIPIGITRVPELATFPWTVSATGGVTRNPWNLFRTPGGSSGGSAAAVAAGLCAAATGSDGGGSIRIPAACCGLVGMKPSRGRVSSQPEGEGWLGLVVHGALARTVADSALMLDAMHGTLPADPSRLAPFTGSYAACAAADPGRLRIAISRRIPPGLVGRVSGEQRMAWERTARLLEALGHEVQPAHPAYRGAQLEFLQYWLRGTYETAREFPDPGVLESTNRQMASAGRHLVPAGRRAALLARRPRTTARILALWERFDVLLTPGLAKTAIAAEGGFGRSAPAAIDISGRFTPFTPIFNLTGQPAISLPAGMGADGLPLSVQLVGRPGAEDVLYSLAGQIERAAPWSHLRPHEA